MANVGIEEYDRFMEFDREKRVRVLAETRRRQILDEASLSPADRLAQAEELLALAWSSHGPPLREEPWPLLVKRRAKRYR